jgi:putative two-component system response regulator
MTQTLSDCTVLIVDDAEANVEILLDVLGEEHDVVVAMDGESALEAATENLPDLILLDIMMPGMNGLEVCRKLKENPETRGIPIIFLTGQAEAEDRAKGFELGAVDFITKPFEALDVKERVRVQLSSILGDG